MGRIVSNFFISLDGVVESPGEWHFAYFDDEMGSVMEAGMATARAFLMGRTLYSEWSQYWPAHGDADEFGAFINGIDKYVVTSSLTSADWAGTRIVSGDVEGRLREIRDGLDGDLIMSGSATTVRWLLARGLLDELSLLIHPVVVGHGQRLFEGTPTHPLELLSSKALGSGVLHARYAPA